LLTSCQISFFAPVAAKAKLLAVHKGINPVLLGEIGLTVRVFNHLADNPICGLGGHAMGGF
jgi:hypothetical protein